MILRGLAARILLLLGGVSLTTGLAVLAALFLYLQDVLQQQLELRAQVLGNSVSAAVQAGVSQTDLQHLVRQLAQQQSVRRLLIAGTGRINQSSDPVLLGRALPSLDNPDIRRRLERSQTFNGFYIERDLLAGFLWYTQPLATLDASAPTLTLYLELDNRFDYRTFWSHIAWWHLLLAVLLAATLILCLVYPLNLWAIRPIQMLHKRVCTDPDGVSDEGEIADIALHIKCVDSMLERQHIQIKALEYQLAMTEDSLEKRIKDRTVTLEHGMEQAQSINEAKSELIDSISREIRTPMCSVVELAEQLLDTHLNDPQREATLNLQKVGAGMLSIIDDVLDYSRLESGQFTLERMVFSIRHLMGDVLALFQPLATNKDLRLHCEIAEDVPAQCKGDPARIQQILYSLLELSVNLTENGNVTASISKLAQHDRCCILNVRISDTGRGLSSEERSGLFDKPGKELRSDLPRGASGLALTLARGLIELMGGSINATGSQEVGMTYTFTLELDVVKDRLPNDNLGLGGLGETEKAGRVLLALDSLVNQTLAQKALTGAGYSVSVIVNNVDDVLEMVRSGDYDLILVDVYLVRDLTKDLVAEFRKVGCYLIALAEINDEVSAVTDLVDVILQEPFDADQLLGQISILLAHRNPLSPS